MEWYKYTLRVVDPDAALDRAPIYSAIDLSLVNVATVPRYSRRGVYGWAKRRVLACVLLYGK